MIECDGCTLCCKFPVIPEVNSKVNEYCQYCKEEVGCEIYEERPESCRIYECAWKQMISQMLIVSKELRPDKCHVLFEKYSDNVIVGVTEKELSLLVLNQINFFRREGISILIVDYNKKSKTFFLAAGHNRDFVREQINGGTKLHRRFK